MPEDPVELVGRHRPPGPPTMFLFGSCERFDAETNSELLTTQPRGFHAQALRM
jgi:hypothetical protein